MSELKIGELNRTGCSGIMEAKLFFPAWSGNGQKGVLERWRQLMKGPELVARMVQSLSILKGHSQLEGGKLRLAFWRAILINTKSIACLLLNV